MEFEQNFQLLPKVLKILEKIENNSTVEVAKAVQIFDEKIEKCFSILESSPELKITREEQLELLDQKKKILQKKTELCEKYQHFPKLLQFISCTNFATLPNEAENNMEIEEKNNSNSNLN
ncbi:mediator of RNA polymerase ii transcription subunit 9 [Anaeramoeba ignava]|uniref:Mediator of RNA polymerase II transcription subunit 9 n=1 Tax=Anaeramoeba ignava TaxID=1746090 RepID=A0A9Q0R9Z5_ANAIG|nr:mediator of RNA polymerase ii transcription subunit 9 [Anaeramoeba ignava]